MSDIHEASQAKIRIPPRKPVDEIVLLRAVVKSAKKYRRYECDMYRAELDNALAALDASKEEK